MSHQRILIVEDEAIVAADVKFRLGLLGYEVVGITGSGEESVQLVGQLHPDLVLMDVQLQGSMDGIAAAQRIREVFHIPVVFLTAFSEDATLQRAKVAEPFGYILKPFEDRELKTVLEISIYKHHTETEILRLNRLYSVLSHVNKALVRTGSVDDIFQQVCRIMVEHGDFKMAWIGRLDSATHAIIPVAHFGDELGFLDDSHVFADGRPEGMGPTGTSIREERPDVINDLAGDLRFAAWHESAERSQLRSIAAYPIRFQGQVCASLTICSEESGFFQKRDMEMLEEVAMDISYALNKLAQDEKRERMAEELIKWAHIFNHVEWGVAVGSAEGANLHLMNPAFARMHGYTEAELIGRPVSDLYGPLGKPQLEEGLHLAQQKGHHSFETNHLRKDGSTFPVLVNITVVRDEGGPVRYCAVIVQDITERNEMQTRLFRSQRMEILGSLASGIAHDLNNVLTPILMTVPLLRATNTDEESIDLLNTLEGSARRGADIVKGLLMFGRGHSGHRDALSPINLLREIAKIARETFPKSIEIRVDHPAASWSVSGNATELHQVFLNLCVNGRDAMPNGGRLELRLANFTVDEGFAQMSPDAKPGRHVLIEVEDTGCGIPPGIMEKIFEPFFTTKEPGKGTGLGLVNVLQIIKGHGGFIQVSSQLGKGTLFKVYLPAITERIESKPETVKAAPRRSPGECVLVVDDEADIRLVIQRSLESSGYKPIMACDGAEAIALYAMKRDEIRAAVVDMIMPVMDGMTTIRTLRRYNPDLPIIAISGMTTLEVESVVEDLHINALLRKPFNTDALMERIRQAIQEKAGKSAD